VEILCGNPACDVVMARTPTSRGRMPKYCSDYCRKRAFGTRRVARKGIEPPVPVIEDLAIPIDRTTPLGWQPYPGPAPVLDPPLRFGSLFSGIGGFDLGLEWVGMSPAWQSEIEPYACGVLERHWPDVPNLGDITEIDWSKPEVPDLVVGGFPCQDLSVANTTGRLGLAGPRSGLWWEMARCIEALRPEWVVIENVNEQSWVREVRAYLAGIGYATLPMELPAGAVGAPHQRSRIFMVCHSDPLGEPLVALHEEAQKLQSAPGFLRSWPAPPPPSLRVDDGLPYRVDRNRTLGNAVVPMVASVAGWLVATVEERIRKGTL